MKCEKSMHEKRKKNIWTVVMTRKGCEEMATKLS